VIHRLELSSHRQSSDDFVPDAERRRKQERVVFKDPHPMQS